MTEYEHFKGMLQSALKEMIADGTIKFDLVKNGPKVLADGYLPSSIELTVEIDGQKTTYFPAFLN